MRVGQRRICVRKRLLAVLALALPFAVASRPVLANDAGKRDFPATLVVEEPQTETEVAPQIAGSTYNGARRTDLSTDLSLQLATPFSVLVGPDYTILRPGGSGFQALSIGAKYQFVTNSDQEIVVSVGVSSTLGGTGYAPIGADTYTSVIPTLFFGKGAGDLPDSVAWARPFALTGQVGFGLPTRLRSRDIDAEPGSITPFVANPYVVSVAGSFQYSLPYAAENDSRVAVPAAFSALIPLVEYAIDVPVANNGSHVPVTGTIDPGFLWVNEKSNTTWGLEALIPINRASGTHPGARLQLSYSFDPPWHLAGGAAH